MDVPSCDACAQGTYSNEENTICLACTAGYVCLGETKQPNPVDEEIDRGFECIEGFYCPEGSYELVPCPVGTYNPNVL